MKLLEALKNLVADIDDYENVNNLSPNPGHQECWQSVENARLVVDQAAKLLGEQKMRVYVTPVQFAWLQDAMMRAEISRDPADVDHIIGQLCIFALSNGSDNFRPLSARVVPTEIEVIYDK